MSPKTPASRARTLPLAAWSLGALLSPVQAAEPHLPRDGWVSWRVQAVEDAPAWCCFEGRPRGDAGPARCSLDGESSGLGARDGETTEQVTVYVRTVAGKLDRLRVLSATCPVESRVPVTPIEISADESARWLSARFREEADDDTIAALAMHRGELAQHALSGFARDDARVEARKQAVFWLSQLRGAPGAAVTSTVMFGDPTPEVRQHAAFSLSQSGAPRVTADLIRLGATDESAEVRAQAWFWLAQTGAPQADGAILDAVRWDADGHVRNEAVFALSQLPDDRAVRALVGVAEDGSLSRDQRKQAVFWLSQSQADSALAYLDAVLTKRAGK